MSSPSACGWEPVDGFHSSEEYERLLRWMGQQIESGRAKQVPVRSRYSGIEWEENWYRCLADKKVWRLVAPDPPFHGVFKPV
jgi:hypothetical protein